jgi:hypothetical protein
LIGKIKRKINKFNKNMKITNLILPIIALTTINNPVNYQVQAIDQMACIEECVRLRNIGAGLCSVSWVNPFVYAGCMTVVGTAFGTCCYKCSRP